MRPVIEDFLAKIKARYPDGFPKVGNKLGILPMLTLPFDEVAANVDLARRAKSANRTQYDQMCAEAFPYHGRDYLMTTLGPIDSSVVCHGDTTIY
jgi:hypothetical protein